MFILFCFFEFCEYYLPNLTPTTPSVSKLLVEIKLTYIFIFPSLCSTLRFYQDLYEGRKGLYTTFLRSHIFLFDGGALLHPVVWNTAGSYGKILRQYERHIESNYGECIIAFDCYLAGPSTKDQEHQRRKKDNKSCANIIILM